MRFLTSVVAGMVLAGGCGAAGQEPSFSYALHRARTLDATLWVAPDGALVAISPEGKVRSETWEIRRITDWDGSHPQEQAVTVEVGYGRLLPNHQGTNLTGQRILFDPTGRYLLIRVSRYAENAWSQSETPQPGAPEAVVDVVDLKNMQATDHMVTDPVVAVGEIGFDARGVLVVNGLAAHTSHTEGEVFTDTGNWGVDTVGLPNLEAQTVCRYTKVVRRLPVMTRYDRAVEQQRRAWYAEDSERRKSEAQEANAACGPGLKALGYASLEDLNEQIDQVKQEFALGRIAFQDKIDPDSPRGCRIEDLSADGKYLLYDCDQSRVEVELLGLPYYRARQVYAAGNPQPVLELKMPRGPSVSGVIAAQGGVDFLVLLRDGKRIEGYRLP